MSEGNSIVSLGELSKPATVLIQKVSNAVGLIYEPVHVRRMARAEVEAEKIRALGRIELTELQQRAMERLVHQEARKQENIESITAEAAKALPPDAKAEALDEDWVAHFFKQCDTVSDKDMQSLWAKLLSGEATKPGSFSKRTVDLVSTIDKKDAQLFSKFCQFAWFLGDVVPVIFKTDDPIYTAAGINFTALKHLDAIGLVSFEPTSGYLRKGFGKKTAVSYYGSVTMIEFKQDKDNKLELGHVLLTATGQELAPICGSTRNEAFYDHVVKAWMDKGLALSSPM